MTKLESLNLGFVENYIGDDGLDAISKTVSTKLPNLKNLDLDLAFEDAKGFGGISVVRNLAKRQYENLELRLSNNEFRDQDIKLMKPYLKKLIINS